MTPAYTSFNGGELSPLMEGRIDFAKYSSGCQSMVNFVPTVQGPVRRRSGTRFVAEVKNSGARTFLARFEFNVTQAFILEFGNNYIRFYTDGGQVMVGPNPYEIVSPYATADLIRAGVFALSMVQSGDVIYIAHPGFPPYKLSRIGNTNWTLVKMPAVGGPFDDVNKVDTITVYASAATGAGITLTASSAIFTPADVGSLFYLEQKSGEGIPAWEVNRQFAKNDVMFSDGKYYQAISDPISPTTKQYTGSVRPTHTEGSAIDGARNQDKVQNETANVTIGIEWLYLHSGFGWVEITGYTSATVVTATVKSMLPANVVGSTKATYKWAYGDWSARMGYPSNVTFFRERLTFGGGQKLWFSVVGDYENFTPKKSNVVLDDDSINIRINSDQVNEITWLVSGNALLIGTAGGEFACSENSSSDPFSTSNAKISQQSRYGGRAVAPQVVSSQTLFVTGSGRRVRSIAYSFEQDNYSSTDLTVLAEHITKTGVIQMEYQQDPDTIVWMVLADGKLIGFTFNVEQGVTAWHRHAISGDFAGGGFVESIQVISTPDGLGQELWMIVRRTINGSVKRYVEYLTPNWEPPMASTACVFVDSALSYLGPDTTVISGLSHLEGATVRILANGATHPDRTVVAGQVTLDRPSFTAQIGLPYTSSLTTMRIEVQTGQGTAQAKQKKFSKVWFRFLNTIGAKYGAIGDGMQLDVMPFRSSADLMDQGLPPFSGDRECQWPIGWERDGRLTVVQDQCLPLTLAGIYPEVKASA